MSVIREFLEAKVALPDNEWLRRDPRVTHPAIVAAVREAIPAVATRSGTSYDDDVEHWVNAAAGDLPPHERHGDRDRLLDQLGHEVYIARGIIRNEENAEAERMAAVDGFAPLADVVLTEGDRFDVLPGVLYSGYSVPVYGSLRPACRAVVGTGGRWCFLPKGARTHGFYAQAPMLVRPVKP